MTVDFRPRGQQPVGNGRERTTVPSVLLVNLDLLRRRRTPNPSSPKRTLPPLEIPHNPLPRVRPRALLLGLLVLQLTGESDFVRLDELLLGQKGLEDAFLQVASESER